MRCPARRPRSRRRRCARAPRGRRRRSRIIVAARRPMSSRGTRTVVSAGISHAPSPASLKPAIAMRPGTAPSAPLALEQRADRAHLAGGEDRRDVRMRVDDGRHGGMRRRRPSTGIRCTACVHVRGRAAATASSYARRRSAAWGLPAVAAPMKPMAAMAARDEVVEHRARRGMIGEADHHVDRVVGQVAGLDHGTRARAPAARASRRCARRWTARCRRRAGRGTPRRASARRRAYSRESPISASNPCSRSTPVKPATVDA